MRISFISLFPEAFTSYLSESIIKRAQKNKLVSFRTINPRDFTNDPHRTVDGTPYGGGPGMVLKIDPIWKAVQYACKGKTKKKRRIILFSLRGKIFTQEIARRLSKYDELVLVCGRYEGVDERVAEIIADEEISMGDFVLSGGELPALMLSEAVIRHIPGVLGKKESLEEVKGSYPVYTRPPEFEIMKNKRKKKFKVPEELLSGNHKRIQEWRTQHGKKRE